MIQQNNSTRARSRICFFLLFLLTGPACLFAQLNQGGLPLSFIFAIPAEDNPVVVSPSIHRSALQAEDEEKPLPYRYAVNIPVDLDIRTQGNWIKSPDGSNIWRLEIHAPGAQALTLYFDRFNVPAGGKLFVYSPQRTQCLGAFTARNNVEEQVFAISLISGDKLTLEYNADPDTDIIPGIHVSEIAYAYRGVQDLSKGIRDFGQSGACEVNINCSEGQQWQQQRRGVARISIKEGTGSYWCSGSLVNNVRNDKKPYFLTADHCGNGSSSTDLGRWIFYFNYLSPACENPVLEPASRTMTGARLMAHGGNEGATGSDFFLVLLKDNIPDTFGVYYNGWSRVTEPSPSGTGIHHPQGDIQKVSTYTTPLISSNWNGHPYMSHWKTVWTQTLHGHGVTEGGSSGSPIFDNTGHIVGTLTGGDSQCGTGSEDLPDYYGKFSYSWDQNGTDSASILKCWLDPDNTGTMVLSGQATSVDVRTLSIPVEVYPNPFTDCLTLRIINQADSFSASIYDQPGKCVFHLDQEKFNQERIEIDLRGLCKGLYFLKLQGRQTMAVVKIIKQ